MWAITRALDGNPEQASTLTPRARSCTLHVGRVRWERAASPTPLIKTPFNQPQRFADDGSAAVETNLFFLPFRVT